MACRTRLAPESRSETRSPAGAIARSIPASLLPPPGDDARFCPVLLVLVALSIPYNLSLRTKSRRCFRRRRASVIHLGRCRHRHLQLDRINSSNRVCWLKCRSHDNQ